MGLVAESTDVERRRRALLELQILDTPAEEEFDDLVALASEICATPIGLVSLVDADRQWNKASIGLAVRQVSIESSFCAHAIQQHGLFLVEDAAQDERFKLNPLVSGDPNIRFYAGMPLYTGDGVAIGTLCVIDTIPRALSPSQTKALATLRQQVQALLELRSERKKLQHALTANQDLALELKHSNQILTYANSQLERLATTDALTGLLNRRAFEERIYTEFADARRKARPLSILVLDIDDFKRRNDRFGHAAGDDALRHVGEVLRKVLRAGDTAARTGGEEFAILLPESTPEHAVLIAKRVNQLLGSQHSEHLPPITMSIGIACVDTSTISWENVVSKADGAMYQAKQTGKNKFVVHQPHPLV